VEAGAESKDLCIPPTQAIFSPLPSYNTSGVVINPNVTLLSNTSTFLLCNVTTLILPADQAAALRVGSVIIGGIDGFGSLRGTAVNEEDLVCKLITRVITAIAVVDGNAVLTTDPATLLDIVQEADFNATANLPEPAPINITDLLTPTPTPPTARATEATSIVFEAGADGLPLGTVKISPTFPGIDKLVSGDISIEPKFTNTLSVALAYRVKRGGFFPEVRALSITLKQVQAIALVVKTQLAVGYTWKSDDIFKLSPVYQAFFPCVPGITLPIW
jgi:hypothetical protein